MNEITKLTESITPQDAAQLLTLVAPGFFAIAGYCAVFPRPERGELATLVASVAFSLPLVAAAHGVAGWIGMKPDPATFQYALLLIGISLLAGYGIAKLRNMRIVRSWLTDIGHRGEPEQTVLLRTVQQMGDRKDQATVTFKDGRVLAGTPRFATGDVDADDRELYLDHTQWWNRAANDWTARRTRGGVLVRLSEVQSIEIDADP